MDERAQRRSGIFLTVKQRFLQKRLNSMSWKVSQSPRPLPPADAAHAAEIQNAYSMARRITLTAISSPSAVFQFGIGTTWCATTFSNPKLPLLLSWAAVTSDLPD